MQGQTSTLRDAFLHPPEDARIMMRWWWFGPAVTKAQLQREMELMKAGGIGGFEVQPVYPLALDDPDRGFCNLPFLGPEFLEHLRFTAETAKKLGLRFDLTLGSGWPYGGPEIPVTLAAGRLKRVVTAKPPFLIPDIGNGERLIAAFAERENGSVEAFTPPTIPVGTKAVQYFISSRTGQMVKRASVGAEGFVLDHYNRRALDVYLARTGSKLLDAVAGAKPAAIFCDSLEAFGSDWTEDLPAEFKRRRGYDLIPLLPRLAANDSTPETRAIRHDWGLTLTELVEERFIQPMQDWSRKHGVQFRLQGYGIPPAVLSSNRLVDLPEGEGAWWRELWASRWASSASHLYGKPVTSSETWTWLHSPSFAATPLDMKAEADRHFLQGITQLIGHGWPYTAEGVDFPGWRFYASAAFNDKNPWWLVMPDVTRYLQRVSHLLRQGKPGNSVALYLPNHDAYGDFQLGRAHMLEVLKARLGPAIVPAVLDAGYGFDFFDDAAAGNVLSGSYRLVVLPAVETMPAETLRELKIFAGRGNTVLATRRLPDRSPGYLAAPAQHQEVAALARQFVKLVATEDELGAAMRAAVPPELQVDPPSPEIGFIRRVLPGAEIYFIANTGNTAKSGTLKPCSKSAAAEWRDPKTGAVEGAGAAPIVFELAPYESRILVLSGQAAEKNRLEPAPLPPIDLSAAWTLRVPGESQPRALPALAPWSSLDGLIHFSGVATYEKTFTLNPGTPGPGVEAFLDFGQGRPDGTPRRGPGMRALLDPPVRDAAEVWVNGKRAGSLWSPPYRLAITPLLKPGVNQIRILVANTAINYMAGRSLPDYRLLNSRFGTRFEPQDLDQVQPAPSGLAGPARLVFMRSLQ